MGKVASDIAVIDMSGHPALPTEYALLFDPSKEQVDGLLAANEYLIIFTFVTVAACSAPDMNWIDGYLRVVRPLWLWPFEELQRESIAEQYARLSLKSGNITRIAA